MESGLSLFYGANVCQRRSLVSIRFSRPEFVLLVFLMVCLIVWENDDRFFFNDPRLQFALTPAIPMAIEQIRLSNRRGAKTTPDKISRSKEKIDD
jgi:hypothetical protein